MAESEDPRAELGRFLRARREQLSPEDLGFPGAGRRRTPGLRREEVAIAAGLSVTWYTYLEQGRAKDVSPSVLDSVAHTLRMSEDERRYIHHLAFRHVVDPHPLAEEIPANALTKQVAQIAHDFQYPVYTVDIEVNIITWNRAATEWYEDWGMLEERDRNLILWLLTSPKAKDRLPEWETTTRDIIARWRSDVAKSRSRESINARIVEFKKKSSHFNYWWDRQEVRAHQTGTRLLRHPQSGTCRFHIAPMSTYYEDAPAIIYHFPAPSNVEPEK